VKKEIRSLLGYAAVADKGVCYIRLDKYLMGENISC
jgi:hypothetical protein